MLRGVPSSDPSSPRATSTGVPTRRPAGSSCSASWPSTVIASPSSSTATTVVGSYGSAGTYGGGGA